MEKSSANPESGLSFNVSTKRLLRNELAIIQDDFMRKGIGAENLDLMRQTYHRKRIFPVIVTTLTATTFIFGKITGKYFLPLEIAAAGVFALDFVFSSRIINAGLEKMIIGKNDLARTFYLEQMRPPILEAVRYAHATGNKSLFEYANKRLTRITPSNEDI
jgi:hypothetical protein